jgi:two-component system, chemotaxis family, sensor kinase CheA
MQNKPDDSLAYLKIKYVQEMGKHLAILRERLPTVQQEPDNTEVLEELFLSAHTIRGSLGMMSMITTTSPVLDAVAIEMERKAALLRKGEIKLLPDVLEAFYKGIEQIEDSLAA